MSGSKIALGGDAYAFETITVADTAKGFTTGTWTGGERTHVRAVMTVSGGMMRYRYDGDDPTASVGHLLSHGDMLIIEGMVNVTNFKAIRVGSQSGTLSTTYESVLS